MKNRPPVYLTRRLVEGSIPQGMNVLEIQQPPREDGIALFYKPDAPDFHKVSAWAATLTPSAGSSFLDSLLGKLADGSQPTVRPRNVQDVLFMFRVGALHGNPALIADTHSLALSQVKGYTLSSAQAGVYLEASFRQRATYYKWEAIQHEDDFQIPDSRRSASEVISQMEHFHRLSKQAAYHQLTSMAQAQMVNIAARQATIELHEPTSVIEFLDTSKWDAPGMILPLPKIDP